MGEELKFPQKLEAPDNPAWHAAKERAEKIVEAARLNEAIRIIESLLEEVSTMQLAQRFSPDKKAWATADKPHDLAPRFQGLSEQGYKREQLKLNLERLRNKLNSTVSDLKDIVLDIEAAKME